MTPEQTTLYAKLATGLWSFAQLPPADRALLAATLRPGPAGFTPEQRAYMAEFYLLAPSQAAVDALSQGQSHQLASRITLAGEVLMSVDVLTDIRPGETFAHAAAAISQWAIVRRGVGEFQVEGEI